MALWPGERPAMALQAQHLSCEAPGSVGKRARMLGLLLSQLEAGSPGRALVVARRAEALTLAGHTALRKLLLLQETMTAEEQQAPTALLGTAWRLLSGGPGPLQDAAQADLAGHGPCAGRPRAASRAAAGAHAARLLRPLATLEHGGLVSRASPAENGHHRAETGSGAACTARILASVCCL